MKNTIQVNILGQRYTIAGDATEKEIFAFAKRVEREITEMTRKNPRASTLSAAILVAMNHLEARSLAEQAQENIIREMKSYEKEAKSLRAEVLRLEEELLAQKNKTDEKQLSPEELKSELAGLQKKMRHDDKKKNYSHNKEKR